MVKIDMFGFIWRTRSPANLYTFEILVLEDKDVNLNFRSYNWGGGWAVGWILLSFTQPFKYTVDNDNRTRRIDDIRAKHSAFKCIFISFNYVLLSIHELLLSILANQVVKREGEKGYKQTWRQPDISTYEVQNRSRLAKQILSIVRSNSSVKKNQLCFQPSAPPGPRPLEFVFVQNISQYTSWISTFEAECTRSQQRLRL